MRNLSRLSIILTVWIVCLIGRTAQPSQVTSPAAITEMAGVLAIGASAPDFVFFSPRTHEIISLRDDPAARRAFAKNNPSLPPPSRERKLTGGPILIYFWGPATLSGPGGIPKPYCPACPKIMDLMQSIHDSFALAGLRVVGFAQNVPNADLKDAALRYSHLVASDQPDLAKALGCTAIPSWALLDEEGKLMARSDTVFERDYIAWKVREAFKQGQSAPAQTPPRNEDWRDMEKNFLVLTMVGKDTLGRDVKKWNQAIKNGYFRAVVQALLHRAFIPGGQLSEGLEQILAQGMVKAFILDDGQNLWLMQQIVAPGPPGKPPLIATAKFILLNESRTIESVVEELIEAIRADGIMKESLRKAEEAAAARTSP